MFQKYIMKYLDDTDCNVLSRVSHGCLDAVIESGRDPVCAMRVSKFVHSPDMLRWAKEQGVPWDWRLCRAAAASGKLESVQWLREQGFYSGPKAGDWGYTDGCPWTAETCVAAARGGHLVILKWAHAHGCPLNSAVFANAANGGSVSYTHLTLPTKA